MYDPIFSKSFSRTQRKRFGSCAIFLCFFSAWGISLSLKPHLHLLSLIGDAVKTQLSINAVGNYMLVADDGTKKNIKPIVPNPAEYLQLPSSAAQDKLSLNSKSTIKSTYFGNAGKMKKGQAICRNSNYCEMEGDIRIEAKSSTILVVTPLESISNSSKSWSVEPYTRKGTSQVKKWRVTLKQNSVPTCTQYHGHPAILFSIGGFTGNYFHDFADVLFPLYSTSSEFQGEVKLLVTDHKPWWIHKYTHILNKLTKHNILDIDGETSQVHCFKEVKIGLKFHKELMTKPSLSRPSMQQFRLLLREAYSLKRERAGVPTTPPPQPRLMIIDRKYTRVITNQGQVSRAATKMGFEVVAAEAGVSANVSSFAEAVNSCDVVMGVHGAGLTNMLFLPDNGVVIQVVPFGGVDGFARLDFGNPAAGMNLMYLEYKIRARESSLLRKYSSDHPILRNPESYMSWNQVWSIYLNQQNVTVDMRRFKRTLLKALKLLRR